MEDGGMAVWLRWAIAGVAALVGVVLIAWVITTLVPQLASRAGPGLADTDQLTTACRLAGRVDGQHCQRAQRVFALINEGECVAAERQAGPLLSIDTSHSPLAQKIREVTAAQLQTRCRRESEE